MIVVLQTNNILIKHIKMSKKDVQSVVQEILKRMEIFMGSRDIFAIIVQAPFKILEEISRIRIYGMITPEGNKLMNN